MSALEAEAEGPDVFGVPEYKVSVMREEITGHEVRLAFGDKRFGHIQWHYTALVSPMDLLILARRCEHVAIEALSVIGLLGERAKNH